MSYKTKTVIPILGMALVFVLAAINVATTSVEETRHPLPASITSLDDVKLIEIRDSDGQVVLSGSFSGPVEDGKGIERRAVLTGSGVDPDARGKAEIEIETKNGVTEQELEIDVKKLAPGSTFKLFVDGREAASFATNHEGEAEVEVGNEPSK